MMPVCVICGKVIDENVKDDALCINPFKIDCYHHWRCAYPKREGEE